MPEFRTLTPEEVEQIKTRRVNLADLEPYMDYLKSLQVGNFGEVTVGEGEKRHAVKRRTTVSVKQLGDQVAKIEGSE